ncbi:MAG TPA: ABC-ATPase domain-containing protein [Acidobacteriota bacterium]|nr:ABC-ATPase domain-containing protein [Acidobacteriota bacterium]
MHHEEELRRKLSRIDGRGYKAYKDLTGSYEFPWFRLFIDHVQGDPFAAPSRLSAQVARATAAFPDRLCATKIRRVALGDYLTRAFAKASGQEGRRHSGTGNSGLISIDAPGQQVLERNSVVITEEMIDLRFVVGLPAAGRRILGREATTLLLQDVPRILAACLRRQNLDLQELEKHVQTVEDQEALREQLNSRGLVAFVANGSLLPRRSGVDDRPMTGSEQRVPVRFESPSELEVELQRPNGGPVRGMGVPAGVTLIVGGGYHGKSTLLRALERGVYNHIPGDGREGVVTLPSAVKIRAEDGRSVTHVDISAFIDHLPFIAETELFSTENASGSTSQAANIIEAVEAGTRLLLLDEDTSATNFMIRDARMQSLVHKDREPITPFIDRVRELYEKFGISTILVMGGSGDYLDVADRVVMMDEYRPRDVTRSAYEVARAHPTSRKKEVERPLSPPRPRKVLSDGFDPARGRREVKIDTKGQSLILFGRHMIDLAAVEQLVDPSQTRAVAQALLHLARRSARGRYSVPELLQWLEEELQEKGLDTLSPYKVGNLAYPRPQEVAAAMNRLRTLRIE